MYETLFRAMWSSKEPDDTLLKCGHLSIGVCGEKPPQKCRICDKNEVTTIFFGNEEKADARFIELKEGCKDLFEVEDLIQ